MSKTEKPRAVPSHNVSFARVNGKDENGRDVLGPSRQVGAIWPRSGGKDGDAILRFDHIPEEMRTRGGGVLFIRKLDALREGRDGTDAGLDHER